MTVTHKEATSRPQSPVVEQSILDAARDLLAEGGQEGLSMRQVADQVGVSATAIYHYFDGKQDLVNRVVLRAFERFGEYLTDAMSTHPEGSVERIAALGEAYLRFALENEAYFRIMFSMQSRDHAVLEQAPEGGGYHLLRQAVADAIDAGTIKRLDPGKLTGPRPLTGHEAYADVVSVYLWSTVHGLLSLALCGASSRCHIEGAASVVDLYRAITPFIIHGIGTDTAAGDLAKGTGEPQ
ncbi:MAG: TetR/AcrR family transcriptional regulator [Gemmatimonadota bacterium]|nr:MAG: TetR/AcrR family transcriptional regulator [Gemmatimonadota bacterium]